jgi:hypothetical protein
MGTVKTTRLNRRMTTRQTWQEAQLAKDKLWNDGWVVRAFAMNDEAGDFWLIIYEREEQVEIDIPTVTPEL